MPFHYSENPVVARSLNYSLRDGIAYAMMAGIGENYLAAFALFLDASTKQIALLASLPQLLGSYAQLLSAWLIFHQRRRKHFILIGVMLQAISWFAILAFPLLFPYFAVPILVICVVVYFAAGHFAMPIWNSLMGDLVPEQQRGRYFARRTALINITMLIALTSGGMILNFFKVHELTYWGFVLIFSLAAIARCYSAYQIYCMYEPPVALWLPLWEQLYDFRQSPFLHCSLFVAAMNLAVAIASPFFSVYMLRDLHFSYLEFSINTAGFILMQFFSLYLWGRFSDTFGNRIVLILTGMGIITLPLWWVFSTHYGYLLFLQMLGGLCWAGFNLSANNFLYDSVPSEKWIAYSSIHSVITFFGIFIGAQLGGLLSDYFTTPLKIGDYTFANTSPLAYLFVISVIMRLLVVWFFIPRLREVRTVRSLKQWIAWEKG